MSDRNRPAGRPAARDAADTSRVSVTTRAALLGHPGHPGIPATLGYDAADPWAVTVGFRCGRRWVRWVLARELLAAGLLLPAGDGDVRAYPHPAGVVLGLDNGDEYAEVLLDGEAVGRVLARGYALVPLGAERVDWAVELDDTTAGGAR